LLVPILTVSLSAEAEAGRARTAATSSRVRAVEMRLACCADVVRIWTAQADAG
jgi:hypothetical protein